MFMCPRAQESNGRKFSILDARYYQFSVGILLIRWFKITIGVHTFNTNHPIYKLLTIYCIKTINFANRISIIFLFISINPTGIPISVVYRHRMNVKCLHLFSIHFSLFSFVRHSIWICRTIECDCWHFSWKTPLSRSFVPVPDTLRFTHSHRNRQPQRISRSTSILWNVWHTYEEWAISINLSIKFQESFAIGRISCDHLKNRQIPLILYIKDPESTEMPLAIIK